MKGRLQVSLQIKILGLVISILLLVIGVLTAMFAYYETKEDVKQAEELALQTAKTLSFMPAVQETIRSNNNKQKLDIITNQLLNQVDASLILVKDRSDQIISEAGNQVENPLSQSKDTYKALVFASAYVAHAGQGDSEVLKGIAPVILDYGNYTKIEGTVTVVFSMREIRNNIGMEIRKMVTMSGAVLFIGIIGSMLLARSIRKDTLGLEPFEIASLFRERNAILQSVKEGILAIDQNGMITMMNYSAQNILEISNKVDGREIDEFITSSHILGLMDSKKGEINQEVQYKDKNIIVNTQPIIEDGSRVGTVASFRDKTELKKMVDAFSEVKQYSEDLRAQAHEFTNKLYVILGLVQLGKKEAVIELIQEETKSQEQHTELFFNSICDEKVQAILLGKIAKASEKKIHFKIEEGSTLEPLPERIGLVPLIVILGNLVDNAFDAAAESEEKSVSFFVTDVGNDVLFEVADSGNGILEGTEESIFKKGFSHKGEKRGYGLANVKEEVDLLGGSIELTSTKGEGTVFTVFLPKQ